MTYGCQAPRIPIRSGTNFVHDQLVDGRALKTLCVIDEYIRECLTIEVVDASLRSQDVSLTP